MGRTSRFFHNMVPHEIGPSGTPVPTDVVCPCSMRFFASLIKHYLIFIQLIDNLQGSPFLL